MADTSKQKFKKLAQIIQIKTGDDDRMRGNDFYDNLIKIDRLKPMYAALPDTVDNGYIGNEVAAVARSYVDTRYLTTGRVTWNYSQNTLFDASSSARRKGLPEDYAPAQAGRGKGNLIDCSTFVGLVLRGIDYANSPYAVTGASDTWNPSHGTYGIRARAARQNAPTWAQKILDYQPAGVFSDIGYADASTIRTAADLAEFYYKTGEIIYDSKRDGALQAYPANATGSSMKGFALASTPNENLIEKILPGDIIFWAKKSWFLDDASISASLFGISVTGSPQKGDKITVVVRNGAIESSSIESSTATAVTIDAAKFLAQRSTAGTYTFTYDMRQRYRFRHVSHIAIAAENPAYCYEATTLKETLYYRKLLGTTNTPAGIFGTICFILRPDYRPRVAQTYETPLNTELCTFPWTFSRLSTEEKIANLIAKGATQADAEAAAPIDGIWVKMIGNNKIGMWGQNSATWTESLRGSTSSALAYNKLTLTPGDYVLSLSVSGPNVTKNGTTHTGNGFLLQMKKAGTTEYLLKNGNSVVTDSFDPDTFILDGGEEFSFDEETGEITFTEDGVTTTGTEIRATLASPCSFTVPEGEPLDICLRLYIGPNDDGNGNSNGYHFGSGSGNNKTYTEVTVSLKREAAS